MRERITYCIRNRGGRNDGTAFAHALHTVLGRSRLRLHVADPDRWQFKGTGNMEMVLDRQISDQRIYPAIDIFKSGTRREELLLPANDLEKINTIRRGLAGHRPPEAIERLLSFLKKFPTNSQMLREIPG